MMGELQLCQLSQFITSLNVDCYAWCLEFDKATGFQIFSLKFHFLGEYLNSPGFKGTSSYLPHVAQCFKGPHLED